MSDEEPIRERTLEEKVDVLIVRLGLIETRLLRLEREVLPQPPDPEVGLP